MDKMERLANQIDKADAAIRGKKETLQMNYSTERYELGEIVRPLKTKMGKPRIEIVSMIFSWGQYCPPEHLWQFLRTFAVVISGGGGAAGL